MSAKSQIDLLKFRCITAVANVQLAGCVRFGFCRSIKRWAYIIYDNQTIHFAKVMNGDDFETNENINVFLNEALNLFEVQHMYIEIFNPKIDIFTGLNPPPGLQEALDRYKR